MAPAREASAPDQGSSQFKSLTMRLLHSAAFSVFSLLPPGVVLGAVDFDRDVEPILHRNCYLCHGSQQQMSELRLDDRGAALMGGASGTVIIPGDPLGSKLFQRVSSDEDGFRMPPGGEPLAPQQIAVLRAWIAEGAVWPESPSRPATSALPAREDGTHWAFRPVRRPSLPEVRNADWVRNAVDRFVLARLESEGLEPSPDADPFTLVRRLRLDLVGLPPGERELEGLDQLTLDDRYGDMVEGLLRSPHFGERWALPWLDLARYADSEGYERDPLRPHAWRWRQWVIQAINSDMPFDRFTVEQVAGDLLPGATVEQRVATGFLRNGIKNREAGTKNAQKRFEETVDRVNTVANTWLGLTVGCAQCHDHKYDPVSQREFYALFGFFHNAVERDIEAPLPGELGPYLRSISPYRKAVAAVRSKHGLDAMQARWHAAMLEAMDNPGVRTDWDHSVTEWRAANDRADWFLRAPPEDLTQLERDKIAAWFLGRSGPDFAKDEAAAKRLKEAREEIAALQKDLFEVSRAYTMVERLEPVRVRLALRGDYRALGSEVAPNVPSVLPDMPAADDPPRLRLARWLASEGNPLTARVEVNRIWQELFGTGLVTTPENFGLQGELPTHPKLLDWLASEFVRQGWSRKAMVRLIVNSATYRQASHDRTDAKAKDPGNALLARQNRLRLPAELVRDSALFASGLLNPRVGGKSVYPPQPSGVSELSYSKKDWPEDIGPDRYRRGLYIFLRRTSPYPMLVNFDAPDTLTSVSRRERSNTPLQALNLLNDPVFQEAAEALAHRILQTGAEEFESRFEILARWCLARSPDPEETERARLYHSAQAERYAARGPGAERAAWRELGRAMLSLDEFITRE